MVHTKIARTKRSVIPAKAGIQWFQSLLDSRFRGSDRLFLARSAAQMVTSCERHGYRTASLSPFTKGGS